MRGMFSGPGRGAWTRSVAVAGAMVAEAVLPQRCLACGRFGAALHDVCLDALPRADGPRCDLCWQPSPASPCARCAAPAVAGGNAGGAAGGAPAVDAVRAAFPFDGIVRRAVLEAKFGGVIALLPPLARVAADVVPEVWAPDTVAPVPLATQRRRRRGFNQAEVAARVIATRIGAPLSSGLVARVRETAPQSSLDARNRRHNLDGAFAVRGRPPPRVLLVDDVTTTASTLSAVARALRAAGAARVYGVTLARED